MIPDQPPAAGQAPPGSAAEAVAGVAAGAARQASSENFPVALRFLPRRHRRHLAALYAFARTADDIGDEAPGPRRALLDELEADLRRLYDGRLWQDVPLPPAPDGPHLPVIRALAPAVAQCAIPAQPFLDLIQANRQDQEVSRYPAFDDLVAYCRLSANPVGQVVLHIFGAATPGRITRSDDVCTALQLVEHIQDVAEDLRKGRIYLPVEDLRRFGCGERDLAAPAAGPRVVALVAFEADRARYLLDRGAPLIGTLRGAARAAVAGYVAGGRAALAAVARSGHDVLRSTPRPRGGAVAAELLKAYATGR